MAITIKKVSSKKELKTFIRFNYELYKENPYSVPDLYDDNVTKCDTNAKMAKYHVKQMTNTALQEVKNDRFIVKNPEGEIEEVPFDYGFICLGMRANTPVLSEIEEAFSDTNVEIVNIGDSKRARRIIEGTEEGRNILNVLARHDYL